MGNKQSGPITVPEPSRFTTEAGITAAQPNADLPIFNLRHINPSGDPKFWIDIAKRYPREVDRSRGEKENFDGETVGELGTQVLLKLRQYKNFIHIIFDIAQQSMSPETDTSTIAEALENIKNDTGNFKLRNRNDSKKSLDNNQIIKLLQTNSPEELNLHLVNSNTKEGLESGKIDSYLSSYGNALILISQHAMVIRKIQDQYYFIDSVGQNNDLDPTKKGHKIAGILSNALPPGKYIQESQCVLQSNRGVCMLYAILFMCYPDLSVVQLQEIVGETFQRTYNYLQNHPEVVRKNQYSDEYTDFEQFYNSHSNIPIQIRNDLYVLAVMEDFLFTDQGDTRRLPPEQRLQVRKTAGKRRKTKRLHKRKPKK
jgi:hypothetical protein